MTRREAVDLRELNRATLARQGLLERHTGDVPAVVGRLAGLQAQHADPPYIALWSRLRDVTIATLEQALTERSVVKATLMRSTLHLVAAEDFAAYDAAVATSRMANWAASARRAGVDLAELHAALLAFCAVPRTVEEMERHLAVIVPDTRLADHIPAGVRNAAFRMASAGGGLVHVPPSGLWRRHERPRYLDARVWLGDGAGDHGRPATTAAMALAVERYLGAYGPASLPDIAKWLGQPRVTAVRAAVAVLGERIVRRAATDGRELVDLAELPEAFSPPGDTPAATRYLARWDSVLIGYDRRERLLPERFRGAVIRRNGDFLPTFLVDGFVAGRWHADAGREGATLTLEAFESPSARDRRALEDEAERLIRFMEPDATRHAVRWAALE